MTSQISNPFLKLRGRAVLLGGLLLSIGLGLILGVAANITRINTADAVIPLIVYILLMGLLCLGVLRRFRHLHINPRDVIGRVPSNQKWLPTAGLVMALLMFSLGAFFVSFSLLSFAAPDFVEGVLQSIRSSAKQRTAVPALYAVLNAIALVVVAPITEEFIFRGVLFQRWAVKWNIQAGLLVSSLTFGLLHVNVVGLSMFGLVMGLLYLRSRTLLVPIACHVLNNFTVLAIGFLPNSGSSEGLRNLEPLRSGWWFGLLLMAVSAPWLIRFISKNFPNRPVLIPYFANLYLTMQTHSQKNGTSSSDKAP